MLYNKFNVDSSSPRDSPTNYTCVVATSSQWQLSRCSQQHPVVCQSDHLLPVPLLSGTIAFFTSHNEVMCCLGLRVGRIREFVTIVLKFVIIREFLNKFLKFVNSGRGTGPQLQSLHGGRSPDGDFGLCIHSNLRLLVWLRLLPSTTLGVGTVGCD